MSDIEFSLKKLAGVSCHEVNLSDHPEAWAIVEQLAEDIAAAERERCAKMIETRPTNGDYGMESWFKLLAREIRYTP